MRVIMLSTDRTIFDTSSPARKRMEEYADAFGALSVVVLCNSGYTPLIGSKLSLYPTNSASRFTRAGDAVEIGQTLGGCDVVTAEDPFDTGRAARKIARALKAPLHIQVHTDFLAEGFASAHWPWNLARTLLAPKQLRSANRIRAVSLRIKEKIERRYRPKAPISVLPIYVDLERFENIQRTKHPRFKTTLLVVSRLEKEKPIHLSIEALKKARDAGIDCGLVIAGGGRSTEPLKNLAKRLGVSEYVEFPGFQNNLVPYYAIADVVLHLGAPYEGYGMSVVEALASGVPVLSLDVGVAREAGAEIAEGDFSDALVRFLKKTPKPGVLLSKPYASKDEYLKKYAEDLALSRITK